MGIRQVDIARAAGVSEATVSLVLNNKGSINIETQRRIFDVARRLGYEPGAASRDRAFPAGKTIGIVVTDISNVYFGRFVKSCIKHIMEYGYQPVIASTQDEYSIEEQVIDHFISHRVSGVIIVPSTKDSSAARYIGSLESSGIKYIYATSHHQTDASPFVMVDLRKGTYLAVKYLLDMGHRKIYFLGTNPQLIPTKMRLEGYQQAYLERGLTFDRRFIVRCEDADFESSYLETLRLLQSSHDVDAIVTINDIMALGCLRALREQGVRIPEDISLIGYDDIMFSEVATIPLTTVHQDIGGLARRTVNSLMKMIQDDRQGMEKVLLEPYLVVRQSTGLCRSGSVLE